jgi:hypothetical protein
MTPFEPDGVYANIPYRVLPDCSIDAMTPGGLVRFKNMDQFLASAADRLPGNTFHSTKSYDLLGNMDGPDTHVSSSTKPFDYYSFLLGVIKKTEQDSNQLRALIYERARFNIKRDILFGYSSMNLGDLVQHINEFEHAVARIEARVNADQSSQTIRAIGWESTDTSVDLNIPINQSNSTYRKRAELSNGAHASSNNAIQILPAKPVPALYAAPNKVKQVERLQYDRRLEEIVPRVQFANQLIGILILAIVFIGIVIVAGILWHAPISSPQADITNKLPKARETTIKNIGANEGGDINKKSKMSFPLPTSYGIYVLSDNKLTELKSLPINVPDPRVALSAEITNPSTTTISDKKPTFILFRRELVKSAPQKIDLRVIARMTRETAIVGGKANVTNIEGAWRIRNISREFLVSPVPGQREMVIAHPDKNESLAAGRYALVLNHIGYDFTIKGPVESPEFCLEEFATINGSIYTQCRSPERTVNKR